MQRSIQSVAVSGLAVVGIGLIGSALVPRAHADNWDKKTIIRVNEPIIAGNMVLDPGTYVWKLMESSGNRHVVQIFDKDEQHLETTVLAMPNYRLHRTGQSTFAFWETPAGVPKAVRAWFYPGDNFGQEFVYPKKLVAQLASTAPAPVPMTYKEEAPAAQPEPQPVPDPVATPGPAPEPGPAPVPQAAAQPAIPPTTASAQPAALPHTASVNPFIGLLGLASLSLAGLLTLATKKA